MPTLSLSSIRLPSLRVVILLTIGVALVITAMGMARLNAKLNESQAIEHNRPSWVMSRLEFEHLRFTRALAAYESGRLRPADLVLRFEILWSRLRILTEGVHAERLRAAGLDLTTVQDLLALMREHEPAIMALGIGEYAPLRLDQAVADFARIEPRVVDLTNEALAATAQMAGEDRAKLLGMSRSVVAMSVVTKLVGLLLLAVFWRDIRREKRISRERLTLLERSQAAAIAKDQFISVVNHELRTPLTSINGSLSLLKGGAMGKLEPPVQRLIEIAASNCQKLAALINDLLDIDKLESGRVRLDLQPIDLSAMVRETAETHATYAVARDIRITQAPIAEGVSVMADHGRLDQVLSNLISNAAKFSHDGGAVEIGLHLDRIQAVITVRDEGLGIPEDQQKLIFERFRQVDSSDHRSRGGTGLGLPIAKALVVAMGGRIALQSKPGEGTLFEVRLPIHDARKQPAPREVRAA